MSTEYGYVCLDHNPPLRSESFATNDVGRRALRTLFKMERTGKWTDTPSWLFPDEPEVTPLVVNDYSSPAPVVWLRRHRGCRIALIDEYGKQERL